MSCTEDPQATNIGYGIPVTGGDSPRRLQVPTFTDTMPLAATGARRIAVDQGSQRHHARRAWRRRGRVWLANSLDGWITSSAYAEAPVPEVKAFVDANPLTADYGKTWDRLLPAAAYPGPDDGVGEAPPLGWTRQLPACLERHRRQARHIVLLAVGAQSVCRRVSRTAGHGAGRFVPARANMRAPMCSPSASPARILSAMRSVRAATRSRICTCVSIGPSVRVFDALDAQVGKDKWVVGLSADHGVTPIPEQLVAEGKDAGRVNGAAILDAVEQAVRPALGDGKHVHSSRDQRPLFRAGRVRDDRKRPKTSWAR